MSHLIRLISLSVLLSPVVSLACPDLSGAWSCESADGNLVVEITQEQTSDSMRYTYTDQNQTWNLIADGKARETAAEGMSGEIQGTCLDEKTLQVKTHLMSPISGADLKQESTVTLTSENSLINNLKWIWVVNDISSPGQTVTNCVKK